MGKSLSPRDYLGRLLGLAGHLGLAGQMKPQALIPHERIVGRHHCGPVGNGTSHQRNPRKRSCANRRKARRAAKARR